MRVEMNDLVDVFWQQPLSLQQMRMRYGLLPKNKKCDRVYPWV